ncbi:translocation/assembly module TamB domain-containing protein [Cytophaga aurantiaca]|uniref:translocation/assembly module TamB domain-containing protein n=1 Tax=Cytophaga aurantiaca TaxID=29530 RepID=UPI000374BD4B|nr:translocation/assembly module TamB domain-containing protein [Cytophaga aurantiaca]
MLLLLILLTIIVIGFRTIYVQEKVAQIASKELSEYLHYKVEIERLEIDWFDHITVYGVSLYDYENTRMIHLGETQIDYRIFTFEKSFAYRIEEATLKDGEVHLINYKNTEIININEFIDGLSKVLGPSTDTTNATKPFTIHDVKLINMRFAYDDFDNDHITGFDHNHFSFDSIYGITENLYVFADTFRIGIKDLTTIEGGTHMRVHKLSGVYTLCEHYMDLENMYARIGNSFLQNYMKISYGTITDLSDFNTKANIKATLDSSFIDLRDISHFASALKKYPYRISISGNVSGKVSKFSISKLNLYSGKSYVRGSLHMDGLPDFEKTYIDADFRDVNINQAELTPFFSSEVRTTLKISDHFKGSIEFNGFPENFIANAALTTAIGYVKTDMAFHLKDNIMDDSYYSGKLTTKGLNLGKLIQNDQLGIINMDGSVEGVGFDIDKLKMKMVASIHSLEFNKYNYKNIRTDAILQKALFNGHVDIADSNLVMQIDGMLDYRQPEKILQVTVACEKAKLKKLNLNAFNKDLLVKTNLTIDFKGTEIDDAYGNGYLTNTYLLYNGNKEIFIDTLHLASNIQNDTSRTLEITSDIISASVNGNFKPTIIAHDFSEFVQEVTSSIADDSLDVVNYYKNKVEHQEIPYHANYDIQLHDINSFLNIYTPGLYISGESVVKGRFNSGRTKILKSRAYIDTIYYNGFEFRKNKINLFCSQKSDSSEVLGNVTFTSENQTNSNYIETENLIFESVLAGEQADFYFNAKQKRSPNSTKVSGTIDLFEPYNIITFNNSTLSIKDKNWTFEDDRKIYFNNSSVIFDSISIYNGDHRITLDGKSSEGKTSGSLLMNKIDIADFSHFITTIKLTGIIDGNLHLGESTVDSKLTISDFNVDTLYIGDVEGKTAWNSAAAQMNMDVNVLRKSSNVFNLTGYYIPESPSQSEEMNLTARFTETDISPLNTIAEGVFSSISGNATGYATITGSLSEPVVTGNIDVDNGQFTVPFLGTTYHFSDNVELKNDRISFDKVKLKDVNNRTCVISGGLNHTHFKNFVLDFKGHFQQNHGFQVLNLSEKEGDIFYGEAYVTGNWEIIGALNKIKITANAKSQPNTKIFIPLNTYAGIEHESYIRFVDPTREKTTVDQKKATDLSGIEMDFNFEITPDAYTEIIFDKKAGDIIRGNGNGNMRLTIDTRGDFNMFGNYEITKGKYNFTLAGIINKEFTIDPGSTIKWQGEPYEAILDIKTRYRIFTSLKPTFTGVPPDDPLYSSPEAQRKYPVNVLMGLKGNLNTPEINLGLKIEDKYPGQFAGYVTSFEAYVAGNPSEMNKQAFSLIVLRKLSPIGNVVASDANSTYANLSELLSNQLSSFVSQFDENLEINVDLTTLDKNGLNTFNMRFAYTTLDGRLRISHQGGNYSNNTTNSTANIVGEWTVEYTLSPSGNLKAKVYNKINQNALITSTTTSTTMAAGMSIFHTQGFDKVSEIFKRKTPKKKKRKAPKQYWTPYKEED